MCIKYSGQYVKKDIKNIFKIYAGIYYIDKGIKIHKSYVGNYFTSLDMMGATLTVMKLDDELKELIDMPVNTMGMCQK